MVFLETNKNKEKPYLTQENIQQTLHRITEYAE